ncbi:P-loop ATPase protein family protein [Streptomyces misionensis]|uniref:p-loop ATPase protein family protein n=2 Tax=Streptomyces misionensis TaxID=67331 RepID=A0A1H4I9B2_9ACTN|nr:P-loop ATPase protein family protein [Streptomyces misionensis]
MSTRRSLPSSTPPPSASWTRPTTRTTSTCGCTPTTSPGPRATSGAPSSGSDLRPHPSPPLRGPTMPAVAITSFGYLHGPQPDARACYDLRHQFRDPHLRPELRYLTARDAPVREAVMATDGVLALVHAIAATVDAYLAGPRQDEPLTVALGCAGGRHRSATVADALAAVLSGDTETAAAYLVAVLAERYKERGLAVDLHHRDLDKDVVDR